MHGADHPFVPPKEVTDFEDEMRKADAKWNLVAHEGAAYNKQADEPSGEAMQSFFAEIFR